MIDIRSEKCKTCIHTKVCMKDLNIVGEMFLPPHPSLGDTDKAWERFKAQRKLGFPCEDYLDGRCREMEITIMVEQAIRNLEEVGVDLTDYEIVMSETTMHKFCEENSVFLNFKANEISKFRGLPIRLDNRLEYKRIYVMKGGNQ